VGALAVKPARGELAAGVAGAALWSIVHAIIHIPRGWPDQMHVFGEWEILPVAHAIASGTPVDAVVGFIHGNEPGAYLVAALVAPAMSAGVSMIGAGKWAALGLGALLAGLCTGWAAGLGHAEAGRRGAIVAASAVAAIFAFGWPGLHIDFASLSGRSAESMVLQVGAVAFLASHWRRPGPLPSFACGVLLTLAWLLSPVALWTAAFAAVAVLVGERRRESVLALAAAPVAVLVTFVVLLPAGREGLAAFLVEQAALLAPSLEPLQSAIGGEAFGRRPGPVELLRRLPRVLEGAAHNEDLIARPRALAVLSGVLLLGPMLALGRALRSKQFDVSAGLAAFALSWVVPLSVLPVARFPYPNAARYWGAAIAVSAVVLGRELARGGRGGAMAAAAIVGAAVALTPSLSVSYVAPSPTAFAALANAAAHGLGPRANRPRHEPFEVLLTHVPPTGRVAYCEGYGLRLGSEAQHRVSDGGRLIIDLAGLRARLRPDEFGGLLLGVGCGATVRGSPFGLVARVARDLSEDERRLLIDGIRGCAAGSNLALGEEFWLDPAARVGPPSPFVAGELHMLLPPWW
jgi:hypothetical protein